MSFTAIVWKEVADLLREKRFGGWALTFFAFWALVLLVFLAENERNAFARRDYPESVVMLAIPAFFVFGIAFVVLALFLLTDGIAKERESGMLPLVGATPVVRWHILVGKLIAGVVAYLGAYVVGILPTAVFAASMGWPAIELLTRLFFGPFLALYAFLLGLGLLFGVAFSSSKVAIGTASAIYFPLFLMMNEGPFELLYRSYPVLEKVAAYTPFQATFAATSAVGYGGFLPVGPLLATVGLGGACAIAAFWLFQRQEVAA